MWSRILIFAAALALATPGARAADLVVWWNEGYTPGGRGGQGDRRGLRAEDREAGRARLPPRAGAARHARGGGGGRSGRPTSFSASLTPRRQQWAYEGRLVDLTDAVGPFADLFDPDALDAVTLLDATTGRRGLYLLPVGFATHHVHAWSSLLERAGFTLADIPTEWEAFWAFWCDQVQPAVRRALGRDDIWGMGLTMSVDSNDAVNGFYQFMDAYEADYVTRDGRLVVDDPEVRRRLVKALDGYTAIYRKGCTPPNSVTWTNRDNNEAFLRNHRDDDQPDALHPEHAQGPRGPRTTTTTPRPSTGPTAPTASRSPSRPVNRAAVFKEGGNVDNAKEFVRFLVGEGWLAHYLDFAGDRMLPAMPKLLQAPFWLDPSDPHRMRSAMQFLTRPRTSWYDAFGDWGTTGMIPSGRKPSTVSSTEGISPEQTVDDAFARIKQILSE